MKDSIALFASIHGFEAIYNFSFSSLSAEIGDQPQILVELKETGDTLVIGNF